MLAAACGSRASVDALRAANADVEAEDTRGWTPLIHACYHGQYATASQLMSAGANIAHVARDGMTVHKAAKMHKQVLVLLQTFDRTSRVVSSLQRGASALWGSLRRSSGSGERSAPAK